MLDDTLIVFGSEFGRTPMAQGNGRDHHIAGFTMWLAGGGIKRRHVATAAPTSSATTPSIDRVARPRPARHDPAQMGIDHQKLTYRFQGRDFRLTDVAGNVVKDMLA